MTRLEKLSVALLVLALSLQIVATVVTRDRIHACEARKP